MGAIEIVAYEIGGLWCVGAGFYLCPSLCNGFLYLTRRERLGGSKREHADSREDKQVGGEYPPPYVTPAGCQDAVGYEGDVGTDDEAEPKFNTRKCVTEAARPIPQKLVARYSNRSTSPYPPDGSAMAAPNIGCLVKGRKAPL